VLAGVLCAALGFAIAVQVSQSSTDSLSTMRESELVNLLDQTTRQADELQEQVAELDRSSPGRAAVRPPWRPPPAAPPCRASCPAGCPRRAPASP
jgi:hypothetical protein